MFVGVSGNTLKPHYALTPNQFSVQLIVAVGSSVNGFSSACARKIRALINRAGALINRAGRCVNRAGRKGIRAGRNILRAARSAVGNMPSWNTDYILVHVEKFQVFHTILHSVSYIPAVQKYACHDG